MRLAAALVAAGLAAAPAAAQELRIEGRVERPGMLALAQLQAQPALELEVAQQTSQGVQRTRFTGVLLWRLLAAAGPVDEAGPRTALRHTLLARGRDGYAVALALAELNPEFEGKQVLVAYEMDGKPLPGLRLVVPGDVRAGRSVRDLVAIELR